MARAPYIGGMEHPTHYLLPHEDELDEGGRPVRLAVPPALVSCLLLVAMLLVGITLS